MVGECQGRRLDGRLTEEDQETVDSFWMKKTNSEILLLVEDGPIVAAIMEKWAIHCALSRRMKSRISKFDTFLPVTSFVETIPFMVWITADSWGASVLVCASSSGRLSSTWLLEPPSTQNETRPLESFFFSAFACWRTSSCCACFRRFFSVLRSAWVFFWPHGGARQCPLDSHGYHVAVGCPFFASCSFFFCLE